MARGMWNRFWRSYERHYALNVAVASGLFVLQLVHLYWLAADPIATRLSGASLFHPSGAVQYAILLVDYTGVEPPRLAGLGRDPDRLPRAPGDLRHVPACRGGDAADGDEQDAQRGERGDQPVGR